MPKIRIKLSENGIKEARREIADLKAWIESKLGEYLEELSKIGIEVIKVNVANAMGADDKNVDITTDLSHNGSKASMTIRVTGKSILFIEYGAGIRFNNGNVHPFAHEHGYGVGTYPGQTHAFNPNGWYWREGGKLHHSYGTQATMPMYKAWMSIQENALEVAKRVFV